MEKLDYKLNSMEMRTLLPFNVPCTSVLDAYFTLLRDYAKERAIVLSTTFCVAFCTNSTASMMRWNYGGGDNFLEKASLIMVPLNDDSSHHWSIAVIRKGKSVIEVFDSMPRRRVFAPVYPRIILWARSFLRDATPHGWITNLRITERYDSQYILQHSPIHTII